MFEKQKQEKNKYEFLVKLTKKEWEDALNKAYEDTKDKYPVQGFRKGKVPRKVIEQNYGASIFYDEAFSSAMSKIYYEILTQNPEINPIANPGIKLLKVDDDGVEVNLTVITVPEVKLGAYKGLKIVGEKGKVTDEQINAEIEQIRNRSARFIPVERPAKMGDFVVIDFVGRVDGKEFEGGKAENYRLELGSHSFIDTFEDQIVGMNIGQKLTINVKFPENYIEHLKNKPAEFDVTLNKVEEKQIPELNDEFASNVSEFETLAELKADIKKHLEESLQNQLAERTGYKVLQEVAKNAEVEIPVEMVDAEFEVHLKNMETRLAYQGMTLEDYLKYTGTSMEELRKEQEEPTREAVKIRLVVKEIIKKENLYLTEEELNSKLQEIATKYQKTLEDYKKSLNEDELSNFESDILMEKFSNFLKTNNEII